MQINGKKWEETFSCASNNGVRVEKRNGAEAVTWAALTFVLDEGIAFADCRPRNDPINNIHGVMCSFPIASPSWRRMRTTICEPEH